MKFRKDHFVTLDCEWGSHLEEFLELLWLQALPSFSLTSQVRQILRETLPLQKQKNKKSSVYIQEKNSKSLKQVLFILRESQEIEFGFFSFAWMVLLFVFARKLYFSCFLLLVYNWVYLSEEYFSNFLRFIFGSHKFRKQMTAKDQGSCLAFQILLNLTASLLPFTCI